MVAGPRMPRPAGSAAGLALTNGAALRYDHGSMVTIRVALAQDSGLLREGVSRLIAANEDLEPAGAAADLPQLLALVARELPDAVITISGCRRRAVPRRLEGAGR